MALNIAPQAIARFFSHVLAIDTISFIKTKGLLYRAREKRRRERENDFGPFEVTERRIQNTATAAGGAKEI